MNQPVISFIGAGHMGSALISGLIKSGHAPEHIWASSPDAIQLNSLHSRYNIHTTSDNLACVRQADILILAVIPQMIPTVLAEVAEIVKTRNPLIISVAAGVEQKTLCHILKHELPIVRAMPNTPALIGCSATALYANHLASAAQKQVAEAIFNAVGITVWLDNEQQMFAVTALSGSGPVFFFLLTQALQEAASLLNLPAAIADKLILQTALGSAQMALTSNQPAATLVKQIASPGGGTEQALNVLETEKFREIIAKATTAAKKRYLELAGLAP